MFEQIFINSFDWKNTVPKTKDINFLNEFKDKINWELYLNKYPEMITFENVSRFNEFFNNKVKSLISKKIKLSNEVLENIKFFDKKTIYLRDDILFEGIDNSLIDYKELSKNRNLSSDFVDEFSNILDINSLIENRTLTFNTFIKNIDKCLTPYGYIKKNILYFLDFDIDFIQNNRNLFKNKQLLEYQKLPTYFIKEILLESPNLKKEVNLARIPSNLDSDYIRELINQGESLYEYTRYQAVRSEETLLSLWDVVDESVLYEYALVDTEFIKRNKNIIDFNLLFSCLDGTRFYTNDLDNCIEIFQNEYEQYRANNPEEDNLDDFEDYDDYWDDYCDDY